jgi:S1-C subfamily serine protease
MRKYGPSLRAAAIAALALTLGSAGIARAADGGYLGVYLEDESVATKGAYIEEVAPESPAEKAGLHKGDIVAAFNGERTPNSHVLIEHLQKAQGGDQITLRLTRDEWEREVKITLGRREGAPAPKKADAPPSESAAKERGFLGCYFKANPEGPGAFVDGVVADSPAAKASLKKGDIVTGVNGTAIKEYTALQEVLRTCHPGQKLVLRVAREGWEREVNVELGHRPGERAAPPPVTTPAEPAPAPKSEQKKPAFLGVSLVDNDGKGPLRVDDVQANSPAEKSSIKPGDVILAIGDKKCTTIKDFEDAMRTHFAGDVIVVHLERDTWAREVKVTLGERTE